MLQNAQAKNDLTRNWTAMEKLLNPATRVSTLSAGMGSVTYTETKPEEYFNLPLILAYAVLDDCLSSMMEETPPVFVCKMKDQTNCRGLERKLKEAKKQGVKFVDYPGLFYGKERRDDVAHNAKLWAHQECLGYIDSVRKQLKAGTLLLSKQTCTLHFLVHACSQMP